MPQPKTLAASIAKRSSLQSALEHLRIAQRALRDAREPILSMRTGSLAEAVDLVSSVPGFLGQDA